MSSSLPTTALDFPALLASIRPIVGEDGIQEDNLSGYVLDGRTPRAAVSPRTPEEVAAVLAAAGETGAAVIPWGGGSHVALGNAPRAYDLALRTSRLDRVLEHEPADLTVTVETGMPLTALQARLAEHGQFLPLDPPGSAESTIGGVLAANASGPLRHAYGTARDLLLGCRVAHVDGTISRGGGRVVKNVAGYDMPKLYIGSLGTLGVLVEASFRVSPLPAAQETYLAAFPSAERAAEVAFAAFDRGLALCATELVDPPFASRLAEAQGLAWREGEWGLLVWAAGGRSGVERSLGELETLCGAGARAQKRFAAGESESLWRELRNLLRPEQGEIATRASVLPSDAPRLMESFREAASGAGLSISSAAHLSAGLVHSRWHTPEGAVSAEMGGESIAQAEAIVQELGGCFGVEEAPVPIKERIDVWGPRRGDFELMRRLKEQFDPRGTLSPGRFLGRL